MREHIGLALWLLTMAALGSWMAVMALDNRPPFYYLAEGSSILPNPVKPGGMVSTKWNLTSAERDCPRTVERIFSDRKTGAVITTQEATPLFNTVRTGKTTLSRSFILPPGLPKETNYRAGVCFRCNVLQKFFPICITSPDLPIDIDE